MTSSEKPIIICKFGEHTDWILSFCFSPDHSKMYSSGADKLIIEWDIEKKKKGKTFESHGSWIHSCDYNPRFPVIATGSEDESIRFWRVDGEDNGKSVSHNVCMNVKSGVFDVKFDRDGKTILSSHFRGTVGRWDVEKKKVIHEAKYNDCYIFESVFLNYSGSIASACNDKTVRIWDMNSNKRVHAFYDHSKCVYSVTYNPKSFLLASGSDDSNINLYDIRTNKILRTWTEHTMAARKVAFHPSGKFLISGSYDKNVKVFDISSQNKKAIYNMGDHNDFIRGLRVSPNGKYIASGCEGKTILLWRSNIVYSDDDKFVIKDLMERAEFVQLRIDEICEEKEILCVIFDFCRQKQFDVWKSFLYGN